MGAGHTYDAWNRLVKVEYDETERAFYQYNGLNWRIVKTARHRPTPLGIPPHPQKRMMYYSADWQLLEEHIDGDVDEQVGFDAELITDSEHGSMGDYGVGDLNRDGLVDRTDVTLVNADMGPALAAGIFPQRGFHASEAKATRWGVTNRVGTIAGSERGDDQ